MKFEVSGCIVEVHATAQEACRAVAEAIRTIRKKGAVVNMAGGTTILGVWQALVGSNADLTGYHIFWGDEHVTDPQSDQNNFALAWPYIKQLLERGLALPQRIHRIKTFDSKGNPIGLEEAKEVAREYADEIEAVGGKFAIITLGLGADGHTASLLPGLDEGLLGSQHLVEAVAYGKDIRVTLTPRAFSQSERTILLVTGHKKAEAVEKLLKKEEKITRFPGKLIFELPNPKIILDKAAAALVM